MKQIISFFLVLFVFILSACQADKSIITLADNTQPHSHVAASPQIIPPTDTDLVGLVREAGSLHNGALSYITQELNTYPHNIYGTIEMESNQFVDFVRSKAIIYLSSQLQMDEDYVLAEMSLSHPTQGGFVSLNVNDYMMQIDQIYSLYAEVIERYEESHLVIEVEDLFQTIERKYLENIISEMDYIILAGYLDICRNSFFYWSNDDNQIDWFRPIIPTSFDPTCRITIDWGRSGRKDAEGYRTAITQRYDPNRKWLWFLNALVQAVSMSAFDLVKQICTDGYAIRTENPNLQTGNYYIYPVNFEEQNGSYIAPLGIYFDTYPTGLFTY